MKVTEKISKSACEYVGEDFFAVTLEHCIDCANFWMCHRESTEADIKVGNVDYDLPAFVVENINAKATPSSISRRHLDKALYSEPEELTEEYEN